MADTLHHAHEALLHDLRELERLAKRSTTEDISHLRTRLHSVYGDVMEHFRLEEENGYMDSVRTRSPRLERTVSQLAKEHRQLADSLESLIANVDDCSIIDGALRKDIHSWVERMRRHETHENNLIQEAFSLDVESGEP